MEVKRKDSLVTFKAGVQRSFILLPDTQDFGSDDFIGNRFSLKRLKLKMDIWRDEVDSESHAVNIPKEVNVRVVVCMLKVVQTVVQNGFVVQDVDPTSPWWPFEETDPSKLDDNSIYRSDMDRKLIRVLYDRHRKLTVKLGATPTNTLSCGHKIFFNLDLPVHSSITVDQAGPPLRVSGWVPALFVLPQDVRIPGLGFSGDDTLACYYTSAIDFTG